MKPRNDAPPSSAALTASGVEIPQILAVMGMDGD
jgi:hypothetical protein